MQLENLVVVASIVLAILACFSDVSVYAQGKGRGGGSGGGRPATVGSPGVDRGLGNASSRSKGRSDDGLSNASSRSNGRSDNGLDRARHARENANRLSDNELNRYRGLSKKLGTTPEQMRAAYQAALLNNPDLKYGQFVSANVVADNLNRRYPNVTSSAILAGLANGDNLGQTLKRLRVNPDDAAAADKEAKRRIKQARDRD
jgi:hypothetical protein